MADDKTSVAQVADLVAAGRQHNAYLIVISSKNSATIGRMEKLEGAELIMGRSEDAGFQIEDDGISRKHAKLVRSAAGQVQLVDLGSTNGTFLNGTKISSTTLQDGDKIQIGTSTTLKFSIQDQLEEQYQRSIYESATRDGLTKVFNKKYFIDTLRKEFSYCQRHKVSLSIVMVDIDKFKSVNDTLGHLAGDYVLARVAQRLNETVRTEDLLARYGGEEFALMLRQSSAESAVACAERCRRAVEQAEFSFGGTPIKVTVSCGVATLVDSEFKQPEDLIGAADKFLYLAKENGRNRVESQNVA